MSGYPTPGSTNLQLRPSADDRARQLGKDVAFDGDFARAPDGDWSTLSGLEALRQAIYNRLITRPGEYKARPTYGVGVGDFVKEEKTAAKIDELKTRIRSQLLEDRRIEAVEVVVEDLGEVGLKVAVGVRVKGTALTFRPFLFTDDK